MIIRLAKAGLAAALAAATLGTGAVASTGSASAAPATAAVTGPDVAVSQSGNYPIFAHDNTDMSVYWRSAGTADITGVTHLTVELPPGVTTDGASFFPTPADYTFSETVSPDGRRLDATFIGTRTPGRSEFMKVYLHTNGTTRPTGTIKVTAANRDDVNPANNVALYTLGTGPQPPVIPAAPSVSATDVSTGPGAGGTSVTLTGSSLDNGTVLFGDTPAAASCAGTSCTATAPGGAGSVPVTVVTPGGAANAPGAFSYTGAPPAPPAAPVVSKLWTTSGPAAGGTAVTVQGAALTHGSVAFGGVPAAHVSCGPTFCTATAPAGTGVVDVTVTTAGGTSATAAADRYTYTA
ncbi:IPT/TIG domain-containing protein [Kitasatospora sp. NPDC050543]|uniref:IPT/TIG domain-containing protein n=1 Tax=Kitasatospora sp. NPDC050543 TaxID=3364054 RepID=UPI0037BB1DC2